MNELDAEFERLKNGGGENGNGESAKPSADSPQVQPMPYSPPEMIAFDKDPSKADPVRLFATAKLIDAALAQASAQRQELAMMLLSVVQSVPQRKLLILRAAMQEASQRQLAIGVNKQTGDILLEAKGGPSIIVGAAQSPRMSVNRLPKK